MLEYKSLGKWHSLSLKSGCFTLKGCKVIVICFSCVSNIVTMDNCSFSLNISYVIVFNLYVMSGNNFVHSKVLGRCSMP